MAELATASIDDLPDSDFAYIEPGGHKDAQGKTVPRALRHFPIQDKAHAANALARAPQSPFGDKAMPKIKAAAKKFGIDTGDSGGRSEAAPLVYTRTVALEDISIRSGGDGRTVEAYAAIFNSPAAVRDQDGEYEEVIDPSCFNRAIEHAQRSGKKFPVLLNHGMTIFHTPDPDGGIPIGVAEEVRADSKGLFTRARYHKTPRADMALEAVREGSITSYSFSGAFRRSDPFVPRGGFRRKGGSLPTVRRMESTLREFGPATFPVYENAAIVGVRSEHVSVVLETLAALGSVDPEERERLLGMFRSGTPMDPPELGTPSEEGPATAADDPPSWHSQRSTKEQMVLARARFLARHGGTPNG